MLRHAEDVHAIQGLGASDALCARMYVCVRVVVLMCACVRTLPCA